MRKFGRLREKIKLVFGTQKAFAEAMGMSFTALNSKLNSKTEFERSEMERACWLLGLSINDIPEYFFY